MKCEHCKGTGKYYGILCPYCNGTGKVEENENVHPIFQEILKTFTGDKNGK